MADAYRKVDYKGLTKTVAFDSSREVKGGAVYIYQVKSGKRIVLGLASALIK